MAEAELQARRFPQARGAVRNMDEMIRALTTPLQHMPKECEIAASRAINRTLNAMRAEAIRIARRAYVYVPPGRLFEQSLTRRRRKRHNEGLPYISGRPLPSCSEVPRSQAPGGRFGVDSARRYAEGLSETRLLGTSGPTSTASRSPLGCPARRGDGERVVSNLSSTIEDVVFNVLNECKTFRTEAE